MKIIKFTLVVSALVILIFSVLVVVSVSFNPIKTFQILKVMSGSMEPALHTGSVVFVKQVNPSNLKNGDIISYSLSNTPLVTHRIVKVNSSDQGLSFVTKGDANEAADVDPVNSSEVTGKVIFSIPLLGYLSNWTRTPVGFILLIILPAILIIINEFFSMHIAVKDEIKKKVNENKKLLILGTVTITGALSLITVSPTLSFFSDGEIITNNTFSTGYWLSPTPSPNIKNSTIYVSDPYTCANGASINSESKGSVTFSNDGNLDISVTVTGGLPNSVYQLWVNQNPGACPLSSPTVADFINTDVNGDGSGILTNHPITSGATSFWVSLVSGSSVLRSIAISF